jgi:hypothetical protein
LTAPLPEPPTGRPVIGFTESAGNSPTQVGCRFQWASAPCEDEGLRHDNSRWFVGEIAHRADQFVPRYRGQDFRRGAAPGSIHAHVQRSIANVGETALGIIELHTRHAKVGDKDVCFVHAGVRQHGGQGRKIGLVNGKRQPDRFKRRSSSNEILGVPVESNEFAVRAHLL